LDSSLALASQYALLRRDDTRQTLRPPPARPSSVGPMRDDTDRTRSRIAHRHRLIARAVSTPLGISLLGARGIPPLHSDARHSSASPRMGMANHLYLLYVGRSTAVRAARVRAARVRGRTVRRFPPRGHVTASITYSNLEQRQPRRALRHPCSCPAPAPHRCCDTSKGSRKKTVVAQ